MVFRDELEANLLLLEVVQASLQLPINTITTSGATYSALCRTYDTAMFELGTRYQYYVSPRPARYSDNQLTDLDNWKKEGRQTEKR